MDFKWMNPHWYPIMFSTFVHFRTIFRNSILSSQYCWGIFCLKISLFLTVFEINDNICQTSGNNDVIEAGRPRVKAKQSKAPSAQLFKVTNKQARSGEEGDSQKISFESIPSQEDFSVFQLFTTNFSWRKKSAKVGLVEIVEPSFKSHHYHFLC